MKASIMAALLCDLAAAQIRKDKLKIAEIVKQLQLRGWDWPSEPAHRVMRVALDEEEKARPKE